MRVLHLANWNSTNIGNGALIYGTERVLREDIPGIEFIPEAWDDYTFKRKKFDETFVELVNAHDALLVNGAVTFNAFRRQMHATGMRFNLPIALWDKIERPIIFYGVSYRCWPFQDYPNKAAFKAMLEYALSHERVFFGVRNDGTKEWIERTFGVVSDRIHEVPDPGLFVPHEDHEYPEFHPTRKNVLLAFNGEDAVYRYATWIERLLFTVGQRMVEPARLERLLSRLPFYKMRRRAIVQKFARAVEQIADGHDIQLILIPHYLDDYGIIQIFIEEVQERLAHQLVLTTGLLPVSQTAYFYGRYAKADLAISMRVHSMSPSIGLNTPVVVLTSQGRMRNFLRKAGLSELGIDVSDTEFTLPLAERASRYLADSTEVRKDMREKVVVLRDQARAINNTLKVLLTA